MHQNKRKAERYIFTYPISYSLPGTLDKGDNKGLILNIGAIGAAIITPYQLNKGDEIMLESNLFALSLPAEVRWVQPVNRFFFRVGLKFRPEDQTKKKQIMNLIAVMKKFSALGSPESRQLQLEQVMSECITKCFSEREKAFCRNEELLRNTLESTADGILVVNEKGEVTHSNTRFTELWHIPQHLMETKNDDALLYHVLEQLRDPEAFLAKVRELNQSKTEDMDTLFFNDGRVFERFSAPLISEDRITGRVWSFRDITGHKQAEADLKKNEEELKSIFRAAPVGIGVTVNRVTKVANERLCEMTGYRLEELLNKPARMLYATDEEYEYVGREKYRQIAIYGTGSVETRWVKKDGTIIHVILSSTPIDQSDLSRGVTFTVLDITERKQAEEALRQSEERQKSILESVQAGILLIDADTHVIADVNPVAAHMIGSTREQLVGSICNKYICPAEVGKCPITDLGQTIDNSDRILITADGKRLSILKTVVPVTIHGRQHLLESFIDITERKQAEKEHLLNETRIASLLKLSRMTDQSDQALTDFTLEKAIELTASTIGYLAFMNEDETVLTMYSWSRQAMKECLIETKPLVYPVETTGLWGEAVRHRKPIITNDYEAPDPVKKGYPIGHVHVRRHMNIPLFDGDRIVLVAGVGNKEEPYGEPDIQQLTLLMDGMWKIIKQKRAEEELRKSEEAIYESYSAQSLINILLSESLKNEPLGLILQKALNMMLSIPWFPSRVDGSIFLVEDQPDTLAMKVRSDMTETQCAQVPFGKCICGRAAVSQEITASHHADELLDSCHKETSLHDDYAVPIIYSGKTLGVIHISIKEAHNKNEDMLEFIHTIANTLAGIVQRKNVEKEKERLQSQLLQAQKMEAIGTLAGGVAHDFNNLLMGILGYTSLMLMKTEKSHPFYEKLKIIEQQVVSGSELTKQLLGFARGGKYEAKPLDINNLIMKTSDIFGRTKKEISIYRKLSDDLLTLEADSGQIEQVLLNLYVNAWQAMPSGGEIYLETQKVFLNREESRSRGLTSGNYIKITVTDTGTGMDTDTQKRIFEPFFTTKEMGRGTGLGLASAYGIIKNHSGMITVSSKKGHGATFTIYLPASDKDALPHDTSSEQIITGDETILFVDDEPTNIEAIRELLETLGYKVYTAQSGQQAITLYRENMEHIDLVILDMVMPGMNGKETLRKLMESDNTVCALLASGYSLNGDSEKTLAPGCRGFIQKPFRVEELSRKIRDVLDTDR
jgi:PAS domain S-box-containing protein